MDRLLDAQFYDEVVIQQLRTIKSVDSGEMIAFVNGLGEQRLLQYSLNHFNLSIVYKYFNGTLEDDKIHGVRKRLRGYEFNIYLLESLKRKGVKDIQTEVEFKDTRIDIVADLNGTEKFRIISPEMKECLQTAQKGINTFEAKAHYVLEMVQEKGRSEEQVIKQIRKARGYYQKNDNYAMSHVYVLADTIVPNDLNKRIYDEGGDTIRATITRGDLFNRVDWLHNKVREAMMNKDYSLQATERLAI